MLDFDATRMQWVCAVRSRSPFARVLTLLLLAACADEDPSKLQVSGNVASVTGKPAVASAPVPAPSRLAAIRAWLNRSWTASAIAQSSCGADVEGVLACLATESAAGEFKATCGRVRSNCEFEVDIELAGAGDEVVLFFCADTNGNGVCEPSEPAAPYLDLGKSGSFCNGDVVRVTDAAVDFNSRTCTGSPTTVVADACAPPGATAPPGSQPTSPPGSQPTSPPGPGPSTPGPTLPPGVTPSPAPPTATPPPAPTPTGPIQPPEPPPFECVPHFLPCDPQGGGLPCCRDDDFCDDGFCRTGSCTLQEQPCTDASECCDGLICSLIDNNTCQPCRQPQASCEAVADCCGALDCQGFCCVLPGDLGCSVDADCCENDPPQSCDVDGRCVTPG